MAQRSIALSAALLIACGGGRPPPMAPPALDDDEAEAADVTVAGIALPRMPLEVTPESEPLADGWSAAVAAITMPTPVPPVGDDWEVESWADGPFRDWMERRTDAVQDAQRALRAAREGPREQSVVASMLLGLVYSRFALDLRGIQVPAVFADDPVRAEAFRNALSTAAHPLWLRALDAFGSCSSVAGGAPAHSLDRWRERCDAEIRFVSEMLPDDPPDPEPAPQGERTGARGARRR